MVSDAQKLKSDLEAACPGIPVRAFGLVDSIDEKALAALNAGAIGPMLFSALAESKDPDAAGIPSVARTGCRMHLALLLPPGSERRGALSALSMAAAACVMAIGRLTPKRPSIEWPDRILLDGSQVAAVRAKELPDGPSGIVVGISANICAEDPSKEAASLDAPYLSPGRLAGEIARELLSNAEHPGGDYMDFYRDRCTALEKEITYNIEGETRTARVMGVDDDGALIVLNKNGTPERLFDPDLLFWLD